MTFSDNGYMMELAGDKWHLKKRYDLSTMEKYYDLTPEQESFLEKAVFLHEISDKHTVKDPSKWVHIGKNHLKRVKNILKIMTYLEEDRKLLNKIGYEYKKIEDETVS